MMTDEEKKARIRELNDELRTKGHALNGRFVAVGGLINEDQEKRLRVFEAAAAFDAWTTGDDPYGEHDFGKFTVDGEDFMFKIDYYAIGDEAHGSEHPEDQATTIRVLTLMYAEDY
ncbi:DUF3768 domain-containing protein [Agrobacterium radiobacter]|uniref:DUF3768 domain-containing protein n=1 Tax=Agrobacterium radiobacter TaxID=362 RepID=UPI003CE55DDE